MKRFICFLCAVLLLTIQVSAIDVYSDTFKVRNGDTYLGIFDTKSLGDVEKAYLRDFLSSDKTMITFNPKAISGAGNGIYYLIYYVDSVSSTVTVGDGGLAELHFSGATGVTVAKGTCWSAEDDGTLRFLYDSTFTSNGWLSDAVIIGGSASTSIQFPSPVSSYAADYVGTLYLEDNSGLMSEVEPKPDDSGGILGFLSGFWDNLKNSFIGLFVPSEGFFKAWYNDLSSQASAKLGAVFTLNQQIVSFFNGISSSSVSITAPDGTQQDLFAYSRLNDFRNFLRSALTGLVVLLTWIYCYRKIIEMIKE